jgi:hypothetical protein
VFSPRMLLTDSKNPPLQHSASFEALRCSSSRVLFAELHLFTDGKLFVVG